MARERDVLKRQRHERDVLKRDSGTREIRLKRVNPNQICIVPFGALFLRTVFKH